MADALSVVRFGSMEEALPDMLVFALVFVFTEFISIDAVHLLCWSVADGTSFYAEMPRIHSRFGR